MKYLYFLCLVVSITACNDNSNNSGLDQKRERKIAYVYADPAFVNITQELADVYESINDTVDLRVEAMGEEIAVKKFLADSIDFAIVSRPLFPEETEHLLDSHIVAKDYLFAQDAITFIVNKSDRDTVFTEKQMIEALTKNIGGAKIVFDENYSASVNYISRLLDKEPLTSNSFATKGSLELIDYVSKNRNSIGILGSNIYSNVDDSTLYSQFKNVKIVGIKEGSQIFYPFQSDIAAKKYPFARNIYILNAEHYYGKYSGFKNFIIGPKGQRIILKSGLLPINMPSRLLNFVKRHDR